MKLWLWPTKVVIDPNYEVAELLLCINEGSMGGGGLLDDLEEVRGLLELGEALLEVDVEGHLEEASALQVEVAFALAVFVEPLGRFAALQRERIKDVRGEGLADCISLLPR